MPLFKYTTTIEVDKTIAEIQRILSSHGATAILTEYDDNGYILVLSFKFRVQGREIGFRLPTDWRPVLQILEHQDIRSQYKTQEQALRVAWRIVKDWIEAQMAIVETRMVTMDQVFLPYATTKDGKSVYEHMQETKFLLDTKKPDSHE